MFFESETFREDCTFGHGVSRRRIVNCENNLIADVKGIIKHDYNKSALCQHDLMKV